MEELNRRRCYSAAQVSKLRDGLKYKELVLDKACIYATGSYGRQEASSFSDLDLFIVGLTESSDNANIRRLSRLDEIVVKADLILTTAALGIPKFDGDGEYLRHYPVDDLTAALGTRNDDSTNTVTARLLLLLESTPLLEEAIYRRVINHVIDEYWRDFDAHSADFVPAFLANDILRLWRTLCVSYEAKPKISNDQARLKAKRRIKNFKLKHSRVLTCFSSILYLMAVYGDKKTVSKGDVLEMATLTPTQRLETIKKIPYARNASPNIDQLLTLYNVFLSKTNFEEERLIEIFSIESSAEEYRKEAFAFGDKMSETLDLLSENNTLYRIIKV